MTFGYNIYFSIKAFLVQKEMCLVPARKVCFMCFMLSKCPHWRHVCFHPTLTSPCQKKSAGVRLAIKRSQPLQPWQPLEAPPPTDWPDIIAGKRLVTTGAQPISTSFVQALTARPAIQPVSVELMLFESKQPVYSLGPGILCQEGVTVNNSAVDFL